MVSTNTASPVTLQQECVWGPSPPTERGQVASLETDPTGNVLYCHGRAVYYRPSANALSPAAPCELRSPTETSVVRVAPSGGQIAVGDILGNVRVFPYPLGTDEARPIFEGRLLAARIRDLAWDPSGRHLFAAGDGRDVFVAGVEVAGGRGLGEFAGPTKGCGAVAVRPGAVGDAVRVAAASDDFTVALYSGTPLRLARTLRYHQRFVTAVAFSPNGKILASAGADGRLFFYGAEQGDLLPDYLGETAATLGTAFTGLQWISNVEFITSSLDGQLRRWDVEAGRSVVGPSLGQQILGLKLLPPSGAGSSQPSIAAVLLDGSLVELAMDDLKPLVRHHGHAKVITALLLDAGAGDAKSSSLAIHYSGDADGNLFDWRGERRRIFVDTDMHGISQIFSLASSQGDGDQQSAPSLLLFSKPGRKLLGLSGASSPTRICSLDDRILDMFSLGVALLAVSEDRVQAISWQDGSILATLILPTPGSCLTCTAVTVGGASRSTLAALGMADKTICLVEATPSKGSVAGGSVTLATRQHQGQPLPPLKGITGEPSCLAISPDGRWLAVGDTQRRVHLFDLATNEAVPTKWCFHTSTVSCLAWSPSGQHLVSGGLDNALILWSPETRSRPLAQLSKAHNGSIRMVKFVSEHSFITTGADATVRQWRLSS